MQLTHLHLEQFRQFRQPLRLDDLQAGINLFVGDNETGKSTIVDAIRAAFFERHKSTSVQHLQPWGDSGAAPTVTLAFAWQGEQWQLDKSFLKKKRCDLRIDGRHFSGDEAEEHLAEVLGYSISKKGASKARDHGIPGLLWVEQGAIQDVREPVGHAGSHLQTALGNSLGEVASSTGDALIARVEQQRGELLTRTGQPRQEYKKVIEQCEAQQAELEALQDKISTYEQQVDELGRLRARQRDIDTAAPWQAQRAQARQAEQRLAEVDAWQQRQQSERKELVACERNQLLYRQQLQDFADTARQLEQRRDERDQAQRRLADCQARTPTLNEQLKAARQAYEQANANWQQARQQAARDRLQQQYDQLTRSVTEHEQTLHQAQTLQTTLQALRRQQQALAIDAHALTQLKQLQAHIGELRIRQEALASRLTYALQPGHHIEVGGEQVSGDGQRLLLHDTQLTIPDVGVLHVQPGGTDVAELAREQQQRETEYAQSLQQLGVDSLEQAQQRAAEAQDLGRQIAQKEAQLQGLVPSGVAELETQCKMEQAQRHQLEQQLAQYPQTEPQCADEKDTEHALETAQSRLKAVEQAVNAQQSELGMARQACDSAAAEYDKLNTTLQAPERRQRQQQAEARLLDLNAEQTHLQSSLDQRQAQIDAAQPDVLAQDIERLNRAADAMERDARQREQQIDRLQVTLQAQGAEGLEEQYSELRHKTQRLQRRRDELARRARALDLLLQVLTDQRQALTRQLQAPLQKHLNHYLRLLFPRASLSVDEQLMPQTLTRDWGGRDAYDDVDALSYGAREQMGLISRLAYADLLRAAGKPTLVILDDALVHCDATRLEQMKRMLYDAAQRHQILLFSCHPENWRDLGVAARDLQTLKRDVA